VKLAVVEDLVQDVNVRVVEPVVTVPHEQRKVRLLTQIDVSGVDELRREEVAVDALLRHEQDPPREMNVGAVGVDRAEDPAVAPDLAVDPLERSLKRLQLVRPDVGRDRHSVLVDHVVRRQTVSATSISGTCPVSLALTR
jgi:hypothetical protein